VLKTRLRLPPALAGRQKSFAVRDIIAKKEKGKAMKLTRLALTAVAVLLVTSPALFAADVASFSGKGMAGFGAAITLVGAGWGFGRIGAAALESMARQPEVADKVSGSMITIAALLEGATFFALIVCLLILFFG
jgi:F-type H+-transporting ATPase subunit c